MRKSVLALMALAMMPSAARADWVEASSDHFVIYADDKPADVEKFARQLEAYHSAMEFATGRKTGKPSPSSRVTVYVVDSRRDVQALMGTKNKLIGGFYRPLAQGSIAVVPDIKKSRSNELSDSLRTLLHEYAHHFAWSQSDFPMPRWMSEGSAEFYSSANFLADGVVSIGRPANHRAYELHLAEDVNSEEMLDPEVYEKTRSKRYDAFYGKSWALFHMLMFMPERKGQFDAYFKAMTAGKSSREAALAAFGSFDDLDKDLAAYLRRKRMTTMQLPARVLPTGPVVLRELTPGEQAMMPVRLEAKTGVNREEALELVVKARAIAALYPNNAAVQALLAENEYDAGNDEAAIAAADRAIALDPTQVNAYVQKGYALFRRAEDADDPKAAYAAARQPFIALNRLENDHPLPLIYFYRSFAEQGLEPSQLAKDGLAYAAVLAPFDQNVKMLLAQQQLADGDKALARRTLMPIAYNPHDNPMAETAREMIERIDTELAGGKPLVSPAPIAASD